MPFRKIFRSRWAALLWAGGVLWTAFDVVGTGPPAKAPAQAQAETDATGVTVDQADLAALANAMPGR